MNSQHHALLDQFKPGRPSRAEVETTLTADVATADYATLPRVDAAAGIATEVPTLASDSVPRGECGAPQAGDVLSGIFRLKSPIGRGAMGVVWLADDLPGNRLVCVKLLRPELRHAQAEVVAARNTFRKVHVLHHQHLCPIYLLGHDAQHGDFLVMKYIAGSTLLAYRQEYVAAHGQFPLTEVVRALTPIAQALDYVHSQGLIHRDVKPANIMAGRDGETFELVDLGLAAEIQQTISQTENVAHEISGTAPYMAPEQWNGETLDGRCDQYALAMVTYQLLAGNLPFSATSNVAWMNCALNCTPPRIASCLEALHCVLLKALSKSKSDRYETCQAFLAAVACA